MAVYYNEFDRAKAAWLRHLIEEGAIAHGIVDERSIEEVQPDDLKGFAQHHFFAGIGLWSLCLRRAGWPDDRPVWTGSCPCGPFSEAGKGLGFDDPRHLWPEWFRLIRERRPDVIFGEQSANAVAWVDLVSGDLESVGYAIGTPDIPAAGFGGAHKRQRFGFVADADNAQWWSDRAPWHDGHWPQTGRVQGPGDLGHGGSGVWLANANDDRCEQGRGRRSVRGERDAQHGVSPLGVGDARSGRHGLAEESVCARREPLQLPGSPFSLVDPASSRCRVGPGGVVHLYQPDGSGVLEWLYCRDGRWRPTEPGLSPLTDAHPARMGCLRGYGDGIDVEAFTSLIGAYLDCAPAPVSVAGRLDRSAYSQREAA